MKHCTAVACVVPKPQGESMQPLLAVLEINAKGVIGGGDTQCEWSYTSSPPYDVAFDA